MKVPHETVSHFSKAEVLKGTAAMIPVPKTDTFSLIADCNALLCPHALSLDHENPRYQDHS
jgi:hypothetical protein